MPRWYYKLISCVLCSLLLLIAVLLVVNFKPKGPQAGFHHKIEAVLVVNFEYPNKHNVMGTQATEYLDGVIEKIRIIPNAHGGKAEIKTTSGWYFLDANLADYSALKGSGNCALWLIYSNPHNTRPPHQITIEAPRYYVMGMKLGSVANNSFFCNKDDGVLRMVSVSQKENKDGVNCRKISVGTGAMMLIPGDMDFKLLKDQSLVLPYNQYQVVEVKVE